MQDSIIHTEEVDGSSVATLRQALIEKGESASEGTVCLYLYDTSGERDSISGLYPLKVKLTKSTRSRSMAVINQESDVAVRDTLRLSEVESKKIDKRQILTDVQTATCEKKKDNCGVTTWMVVVGIDLLLVLAAVVLVVREARRRNG